MRLLEKLPAGKTPTDDEYADALEALIDMVDGWQIEPLMIYAMRDESITIVSSQNSYTVGPSGGLVTTRPDRIDTAYVLSAGYSYDVTVIQTAAEYAAIVAKTSESAWPTHIYYKPSMPDGTVYVYPEGTLTSATLHIITKTPLTVFTAITDTVSLPPGYRKAISSNLALEIAPEYGTTPSAEVVKMARESLAAIKRANSRPIRTTNPLAGVVGSTRSNIITG